MAASYFHVNAQASRPIGHLCRFEGQFAARLSGDQLELAEQIGQRLITQAGLYGFPWCRTGNQHQAEGAVAAEAKTVTQFQADGRVAGQLTQAAEHAHLKCAINATVRCDLVHVQTISGQGCCGIAAQFM